jgi:mRNA interferase HigB
MHIISRKKLKEAAIWRGELEGPLDAWHRITKKALWRSLADVRKTFANADSVARWTVFNVKGNQYHLIIEINYEFGRVYIRRVLTYSEYDRGGWKQ